MQKIINSISLFFILLSFALIFYVQKLTFLSPLCSYELKANIQTVNEAAVCIYNAPITMYIYIIQSQSLLKKEAVQ